MAPGKCRTVTLRVLLPDSDRGAFISCSCLLPTACCYAALLTCARDSFLLLSVANLDNPAHVQFDVNVCHGPSPISHFYPYPFKCPLYLGTKLEGLKFTPTKWDIPSGCDMSSVVSHDLHNRCNMF